MEINNKVSLFQDEINNNFHQTLKTDSTKSAKEINDKYVKGEVRIVTEQARYPLNTVVGMVDNNPNYILNPEFQRRHRWNNIKKSRLIESFIMNVPIPPIFLYESEFSVYEVMDGLQRLTAIKQFYKNQFPLEGLDEWKELNGYTYEALPEQVKKGIDRRYLSSIILLQETAKDPIEAQRLKQLVFERINSGGEKLRPQESRNAIYNGQFNQLCIRLARNEFFCALWDIPKVTPEELLNKDDIPDELVKHILFSKMEDVELVLRFFSYRQLEKFDYPIEEFLDDCLKAGNLFSQETLNSYSDLFEKTIKLVYDVLGESAFWIYRKRKSLEGKKENWEFFTRATKVAYDPIMYVFSLFVDSPEKLLIKREEVQARLIELYKENYTSFEGRNNNRSDVIRRINLVNEFINKVITE